MAYTIIASRQGDRRIVEAETETVAIDAIDDFVAGGFSIESVLDHDGKIIAPALLLDRYLAEQGD